MKNLIAFKFLAILLCAAALLGAVGSGVGILVLTEMDLYNTTVEEFCVQKLNSDSITFAYGTLNTYAEQNLGDFPTAATAQTSYYTYGYNPFPVNSANYQILDTEGNVVEDQMGVSLKDPVTYTFPASGTYRKVQSIAPVQEEPSLEISPTDLVVVTDNIPRGQNVVVYGISLGNDQGSAGTQDTQVLGIISHKSDGTVYFTATTYVSIWEDMGLAEGDSATSVGFYGRNGEVIYEASSEGGVGIFQSTEDGYFTYQSFTASQETTGDTYVYNYLPQDKDVLVSSIEVGWDGGSADMEYAALGYLRRYEDDTVGFSATSFDSFGEEVENPVTYICFLDPDGDILFMASNPNGVGSFFYNSRGGFCFRSTTATQSGTINTYVNAYQEPDLTSGVVSSLGTGFAVEISKTRMVDDVEWGYINGIGWVLMDQVTLSQTSRAAEPATTSLGLTYYQATAKENAVAHAIPDTQSEATGTCDLGGICQVYQQAQVEDFLWYYTDLGWVLADSFTLSTTDQAPEVADTAATAAVVDTDTYFYKTAGQNAQVLASCPTGTVLELLLQENVDGTDWAQTPDGWVKMDCLSLQTTSPTPLSLQNATLMVVSQETPAYQTPATNAQTLDTLYPETTAVILEQTMTNGVLWGNLPGGGWVQMNALETLATALPSLPAPLVAEPVEDSTTPTLAEEPVLPATAEIVKESDEPTHTVDYWDSESQQYMRITYTQVSMPEYTLVLYLEKDLSVYFPYYAALEMLWGMRNDLYQILIGGLLLFAVLAVYLCCAAGRKPGSEEIHPAGFNVLPLDLYLVAGGGGILGLLLMVDWASYSLMEKNWETCVGFGLCAAYVGCLIFVAFCYACAAQFKTPGGYWWRNTLCVRLPVGCWKLARWIFPGLGRVLTWCWKLVARIWNWAWGLVKGFFRWCYRKLNQFLKLLPLTWQWLLAGSAIFLLLLMAIANHGLTTVLCLAGCVAIILYGAHCFGILAKSAKRMSKGDLDIQVEDPWMLGAFQEFAQDLNGLAGVAVVAAQKQLKSERMKTELITNVSHDIKTPLTSIINYVDLLQKPHTEEEGKQYLEVLDRQSQRLKKLIEDLMEMSKANTGNMTVDIKPLDAVEAVNQALGEFADKLEKAQLVPVFRRPEEPVTMLADGRLTWRVLSNLLGNAVKYALPGTRLYIDLMVLEGKVVLSLKNISREELNMEADELMERFVRGDSSRNTEGSGLGLNIAKSLMELQKGSLQLLVDGDLFKVTLIFPAG